MDIEKRIDELTMCIGVQSRLNDILSKEIMMNTKRAKRATGIGMLGLGVGISVFGYLYKKGIIFNKEESSDTEQEVLINGAEEQ